jgi:UDP-N-acetylglucosamine acyltransferase
MGNGNVHPTAIVGEAVELGEGVRIGPYVVIEGPASIGAGTRIGPHAVICPYVALGPRNAVHAHAVIGDLPQDVSFDGAETWVQIGEANVFREGVTVHRSTKPERPTRIGSGCYLMAGSHVAHDCRVGDRVILTNGALLGGHVEVGDRAIIGGGAGVHQFVRVGELAMVAAYTAVRKDVLPFTMLGGEPPRHYRLNTVGLRRAGFGGPAYRALESAFRRLRAGLELERAEPGSPAERLASWLEQPSKRGLYGYARPEAGRRDA